MTPLTIRKTLSPNDAGETGTHQAGIPIPKDRRILTFFPRLRSDKLNPRTHIVFKDPAGQLWELAFIYYNNSRFGGTRNEYRLTRMTNYIRQAGMSSGDEIVLHRDATGQYSIEHNYAANADIAAENEAGVLRLGGGWRIIDL